VCCSVSSALRHRAHWHPSLFSFSFFVLFHLSFISWLFSCFSRLPLFPFLSSVILSFPPHSLSFFHSFFLSLLPFFLSFTFVCSILYFLPVFTFFLPYIFHLFSFRSSLFYYHFLICFLSSSKPSLSFSCLLSFFASISPLISSIPYFLLLLFSSFDHLTSHFNPFFAFNIAYVISVMWLPRISIQYSNNSSFLALHRANKTVSVDLWYCSVFTCDIDVCENNSLKTQAGRNTNEIILFQTNFVNSVGL
jgi:hypothetical protein